MTRIPIPTNKRREVAEYCSHAISPRRYYIHSTVGGVGWNVTLGEHGWTVEASEQHLIILRLKLGV